MAVVYGTDEGVDQPVKPSLVDEAFQHPFISLLMVLIIAVIIGYIISRITGISTSGNNQAQLNTTGLPTVNSNGQQVVYVPTSDTFLNYSNTTDSNNTAPVNSPTTTTVNPPAAQPSSYTALIRARYNASQNFAWDSTQPNGIPIRTSATNGTIVGYVPYGTSITVTGQPTSGNSNEPGGLFGSTQWLPVQGGVISAYDITGLQPVASVGTGMGGLLPSIFTRTASQQYHLRSLETYQ